MVARGGTERDLGHTVEEELQALDTKPGEQKQRNTDWESQQRFQLAQERPRTGRERAVSAAQPMPTACGERKAGGGCSCKAGVPIPQPDLERHSILLPSTTKKGSSPL